MKSTKYDSYLEGELVKGCKLCVKGQKMVLFVTGLCSRGCEFCPLSKKRKSLDQIYANERKILNEKDIEEILNEVKVSGAKGCSLTGGDPLLKLDRTIQVAKALKNKFGKKFHIHIYLSTRLVTEKVLERLSKVVDEVRFHPDLDKPLEEEIQKMSFAKKFWNKKSIGIEIPCFPERTEEILELVKKSKNLISFLNLNELESGEFSEKRMNKKYKINKNGYTVKDSIEAGKYLIKEINSFAPKLNLHLCTAELKNWHQYKNRLKNYKIPKFTKRTSDGTIIYFATEIKNKINLKEKEFYLDLEKRKLILDPKIVLKLKERFEIYKIEEYPTFDREEVEVERII